VAGVDEGLMELSYGESMKQITTEQDPQSLVSSLRVHLLSASVTNDFTKFPRLLRLPYKPES